MSPTPPAPQSPIEGVPAGRHMPWLVPAALAVAVLGGLGLWSRRTAIDPRVVGRWDRDMSNQSGAWQGRFAIRRDNTYQVQTVVKDYGRLVAGPGQFRMISSTHTSASGTYRVLDASSLEVTSAMGKVIWKRQGTALAASSGNAMLGVWDASPVIGGITWHQTVSVTPDSAYALTSVTGDSGRIVASAGQWHMISHGGRESDGTYTLATPDQLTFVAPEGRSVWRRDSAGAK